MGRTFACSDLHGNYALWEAIKEFLQPDDVLYYLGDATDRGAEGWSILKEMLIDERIHYIVGNHDIMLANRIKYPISHYHASIHDSNGGYDTWVDAKADSEALDIAIKIFELPLYAVYENTSGFKVFMSHSGCTDIEDEHGLVWDREEFFSREKPRPYDYVIHGHTTIPHLISDLNMYTAPTDEDDVWEGGAYWYTEYRCDIDCLTVATGMTVLLDLDTFEEEIFVI